MMNNAPQTAGTLNTGHCVLIVLWENFEFIERTFKGHNSFEQIALTTDKTCEKIIFTTGYPKTDLLFSSRG